LSGEDWESFKEARRFAQRKAHERRGAAVDCYWAAAQLASHHGLELRKHNETHYSLRGADFIVNIYPGTCYVFCDPNRPRKPDLDLPTRWDLVDAVEAGVRSLAQV
jgi:hypothetical protein